MKQQADQHRSERNFEVGDCVFIRLQPYKQMSLKQEKEWQYINTQVLWSL